MADAQRHTFRDHDNVPGVCWRTIDGTNNICGRAAADDVHQPAADITNLTICGADGAPKCTCGADSTTPLGMHRDHCAALLWSYGKAPVADYDPWADGSGTLAGGGARG